MIVWKTVSRDTETGYSHRERKQEENEKIRSNMKSLENNQDDNQKMYDAMRQINKMKPKTPLAVSSKDDQTTDKVE